jgi:dienelactone hydrolase
VRRFAAEGYRALCPNLYSREAPGADPGDAAATVRAASSMPAERLVGDAFFAVDRPFYRPEAAVDGWRRILDFFRAHLTTWRRIATST